MALALALAVLGCAEREQTAGGVTPRELVAETASEEAQDLEAGPGRWHEFRTSRFDSRLSEEQRERVRQLESIGYAAGSTATGELRGVTLWDRERAFLGLNLYTSGHAPEAVLMDMEGRVVHRWTYDFWRVWPDYPVDPQSILTRYWRRAYLLENGDLLAIFAGLGLIKLDRDSNLIWATPNRAHHALDVQPDGTIYALTREARMIPEINASEPILEDFVSVLDSDGNELRRVSLLECMRASEFAEVFERGKQKHGDVFHTNSLEILDGSIAERAPAFAKGRALVSLCKLNLIGVVDLDDERFVWTHRGSFKRQHDPKILASGNLMLFDNGGRSGISRVLELDPATLEPRWTYAGTDEAPFYSQWCGIADRLPKGNTLITETDGGRAFEVTPDGDLVWEFFNPHRAGDAQEFIASLFEVVRIGSDVSLDWLDPDAGH